MLEATARSTPVPPHQQQGPLQCTIDILDTNRRNRSILAIIAADAEHHLQEAAGLSSRLSAIELQRLCVLLHLRCIRMALKSAPGQQALLQAALADLDELIALEGSSAQPSYLHWRGTILFEMQQHSLAVAGMESALAACRATPGEAGSGPSV